ncbi:MAG: prolyl oligopeptidase family serine peptidase [Candidatus Thermoplasmatota archaeon]|nr:prolyl oligopeptidase family serine peptidase [Candidatus Thermoplasmatota archaeon]MBU1940598.1 prolyl oligopeptidase family serine peptidase [Candidatus Thermoplasmatota archaeon]
MKIIKNKLLGITLVILLTLPTLPLITAANTPNPTPNYTEEWIENRRFLWQLPTITPPPDGYPILFILHGASQYAETWFNNGKGGLKGSYIWGTRQTEFTKQALEQGFAIIAPDSIRPYPFGPKAWDSETQNLSESSDLRFINTILTWLHNTSLPLNLSHICCIGFSSGGFMTSRIGYALGNKFQALGIHSGANANSYSITWQGPVFDYTSPQSFPPEYPSTLIIHGIKDHLVPASCGIKMYEELQNGEIPSAILLNPAGHHIWQSSFNSAILTWFQTGYKAPEQPPQPTTGPGGNDYTHTAINVSNYGSGDNEFWIFTPAKPTPPEAPIIIFNHGWGARYPSVYQAWIDHLVKRGNIVIYPRYQKYIFFGYNQYTNNAINAVKTAFSILENDSHIIPDKDRVAIVGHSLGGGITAYMAARAETAGLPIPKAIMPVQPYLGYSGSYDFADINNETLMLVIVGANDTVVRNTSARTIFYETSTIPLSQKEYIIQITDSYGYPSISSDHGAPTCAYNNSFLNIDAMDYFSTWKLFDALTDYAFYETHHEYCFGNTPEQRFMGLWSDGTPVTELVVSTAP